MNDRFQDLRVFVAVVQSQSFNGAAERLGLVKSAVSRRIREMEDRLGTQLLNRTTRNISVTDAGAELYWRGLKLLADLQEAEDAVAVVHRAGSGRLRIAAPVALSAWLIAPLIGEFVSIHPRLDVELHSKDEPVDLVGEGFDVVIRICELRDSSLVARRITSVPYAWTASSSYLSIHGRPKQPEDLRSHRAVSSTDDRGLRELLESTGIEITSRIAFSSEDAMLAAVLSGLGIGLLPLFATQAARNAGALEIVLAAHAPPPMAMYATFANTRNVPTKIRLFLNFLVSRVPGDRIESLQSADSIDPSAGMFSIPQPIQALALMRNAPPH